MIVARCKELATQLSVANEAFKLQSRLERLQHEASRVESLRRRIERASEILIALSSSAVDSESKEGVKEAIAIAGGHSQLTVFWTPLEKDENLLGGRDAEAYKKAFHATKSVCENLRRVAEQAWRDHARRCLSDDGPILDVFQESNPRTVDDLRRRREELQTMVGTIAPSSDEIEEFNRKVSAYNADFRRLGGDIRKEIRDALQAAVSPGGAPIGLFSSDVMGWLQEHGVVESFRVTVRSAP